MARGLFAALLVVAALTARVGDADANTIGCPPGQAIRGIDFVTHRLVCISVGAEHIAALESAVAALQGQVAALEALNTAQAAAIAALQGEVDQLQAQTTFTSPNDQYSITVADTGITLAGPDVSIQLRNDPGPVAIIELTTADLLVNAARNTAISSGLATSVRSDTNTSIVSGTATNVTSTTNTNVVSGGQTNVTSGGNTSLQGASVRLNGGCDPVAHVGDFVVPAGGTLVIGPNASTVFSC